MNKKHIGEKSGLLLPWAPSKSGILRNEEFEKIASRITIELENGRRRKSEPLWVVRCDQKVVLRTVSLEEAEAWKLGLM